MKGRIVLGVVGVLVAGALVLIMTVLGIPMEFAIAWLLILTGVVLATRQSFIDEGSVWPPEPPTALLPGSDVSRLAWSLNPRTGVAGHVIVGRVERMLRRRLAHHGLDLDDPAQAAQIDALIGPGIRDVFSRREVRRRDLEQVLDAIERIPQDDTGTARQER